MEQEVLEFYKSLDFMKLGQALQKENWQAAAMIQKRMESKIRALGLQEFSANIMNVRQCIIRKDARGGKQILALMIAKRVKVLNEANKR